MEIRRGSLQLPETPSDGAADSDAAMEAAAERMRRVSVEVGEDGGSSVVVRDGDGRARARLGVSDLGTTKAGATEKTAPSSLVLFDKDGKVLERLPK